MGYSKEGRVDDGMVWCKVEEEEEGRGGGEVYEGGSKRIGWGGRERRGWVDWEYRGELLEGSTHDFK